MISIKVFIGLVSLAVVIETPSSVSGIFINGARIPVDLANNGIADLTISAAVQAAAMRELASQLNPMADAIVRNAILQVQQARAIINRANKAVPLALPGPPVTVEGAFSEDAGRSKVVTADLLAASPLSGSGKVGWGRKG